MIRRATCGFWLVVYRVKPSVPRSYSPIAARGSIAFGTSRLLIRSTLVTWAALANAWSTAARSPSSHSYTVLRAISSCTWA